MSSSNYSISYPGNPPNVSTNNVNVSTLSGIVSYDPNGAVSREILNTPCSTPFSQAQSISLFSLTNDIYVNSSTIIYIPYIYYTFNLNFVTSTCFKLIFSLPSQYISGMMSGTTITTGDQDDEGDGDEGDGNNSLINNLAISLDAEFINPIFTMNGTSIILPTIVLNAIINSKGIQFDVTIYIFTIKIEVLAIVIYFDFWLLVCGDPTPPVSFLNFYVIVTLESFDIDITRLSFTIPLVEETGDYLTTLFKTMKDTLTRGLISGISELFQKDISVYQNNSDTNTTDASGNTTDAS